MQNTLSVHNQARNPNFDRKTNIKDENIHELLSHNFDRISKMARQVAHSNQQKNAPRYSFEYFGLNNITQYELIQLFGHIQFIVVCGERKRAEKIAMQCYKSLKIKEFPKIVRNNFNKQSSLISQPASRVGKRSQSSRNLFDTQHSHQNQRSNYSRHLRDNRHNGKSSDDDESNYFTIYRVGSILCCNHGMGVQSISIFLNELLRMMQLSKNSKYSMLRLGSAGGIGVEGGTMVASTHVLDPLTLKPEWRFWSCGKENHLECIFDENIYNKLYAIGKAKKYPIVKGKTVATECYYEGQARLDGAICGYNDKNKMEYLEHLHKGGVRNFEMEVGGIFYFMFYCFFFFLVLRKDITIKNNENFLAISDVCWLVLFVCLFIVFFSHF